MSLPAQRDSVTMTHGETARALLERAEAEDWSMDHTKQLIAAHAHATLDLADAIREAIDAIPAPFRRRPGRAAA